MSSETTTEKKRRGTSVPLLIGILILGGVGVYAGPAIMTYVFYLQEVYTAAVTTPKIGPPNLTPTFAEPQTGPSKGPVGATGGAPRGGPAGGGPAGGGNFNPEEIFTRRDEDGNGKLEGAEISERMQARLEELDKDADKAISKEEFIAGAVNRQAGGGGPQRPASDNASTESQPAAPPVEKSEPTTPPEPKSETAPAETKSEAPK